MLNITRENASPSSLVYVWFSLQSSSFMYLSLYFYWFPWIEFAWQLLSWLLYLLFPSSFPFFLKLVSWTFLLVLLRIARFWWHSWAICKGVEAQLGLKWLVLDQRTWWWAWAWAFFSRLSLVKVLKASSCSTQLSISFGTRSSSSKDSCTLSTSYMILHLAYPSRHQEWQ